MKIYKSIEELVGSTPLLDISNFIEHNNVFAKLELFNPAGSIKDRVALQMILDAEESGKLSKGSTIIEPTSGNTGIGLAAIGVSKGYNVIITMPNTMSAERIKMMEAYGAKAVLTDGSLGMTGAIDEATKIASQIDNALVMGQFVSPSNTKAHYNTTGPEIWNDLDGKVDIVVSSVGTGGTITGVAKYLKEKNSNIKVIAVEPASSAVLSGKKAGAHKIQGIGAGFIPEILNLELIDEIIPITDEAAYSFGKNFAEKQGILVGISSGAALSAAKTVAQRAENKDKNIVVILPDTGSRYLSTPNYY